MYTRRVIIRTSAANRAFRGRAGPVPGPDEQSTALRSAVFFHAEDGIRDYKVTGVQTCALPIWNQAERGTPLAGGTISNESPKLGSVILLRVGLRDGSVAGGCRLVVTVGVPSRAALVRQIGRAACRGRGEVSGGAVTF